MNTPDSRRRLLKLAGSLPLALPVITLAQGSNDSGLAFLRVQNQVTATGVHKDTMVIVDASVTTFDGNGYYLYPDWGQPVVYEVRLQNARLAFYYPGTSQRLWSMTSVPAVSMFSGRVEGILNIDGDEAHLNQLVTARNLQRLEVPTFPAIT